VKPGTVSYIIATYAAIMSIAALLIGITEGSWQAGLFLALLWAIIATGCYFFGRWRRARLRQHQAVPRT